MRLYKFLDLKFFAFVEILSNLEQYILGESSDEEMTNEDRDKFALKKEELEKQRLALFDDVIEEYVDTRLVLNRFNQFRDIYHKWYKVCFIEECAGSCIIPILKGLYNSYLKTNPKIAIFSGFWRLGPDNVFCQT